MSACPHSGATADLSGGSRRAKTGHSLPKVDIVRLSLGEVASMSQIEVRYDDGVAYEKMMGTWSRAAGEIFLEWLAPSQGLRWIDVGCGTGAFTELIIGRWAPAEVQGVDPSDAQLSFARTRPLGQIVKFQWGGALSLPFSEAEFDVAVM